MCRLTIQTDQRTYGPWAAGHSQCGSVSSVDTPTSLKDYLEENSSISNRGNILVRKVESDTANPADYTFAENAWGNYYYKIYPSSMSYLNAKAQCESDGATLAAPRSDAENDFIIGLLPGQNIWVGIDDIDQENRFVYGDGSDVSYTKWNTLSQGSKSAPST